MIKRLCKNLFKFFFRRRDEDILFFPFFRISIGLFTFFHFLFLQKDFYYLYRKHGLIDEEIMLSFKPDIIPNIGQTTDFLLGWTHFSERTMLMVIAIIYLALAIFLTLGLFSRLSALLLLLLHLIIFKGSPLLSYGADNFTSIALFYCFFFPVGAKFAIDKIWFKNWQVNASPYRRILQIHLSLIYVSSGLAKIMGGDWRSGEAIWQSVHLLKYNLMINSNYSIIAAYPTIALILSWGVLVIEIFYPVLMFNRKFPKIGMISVISMHAGIAITMGLYYFSLLMIILTLSAFLKLGRNRIEKSPNVSKGQPQILDLAPYDN